MAKDSINLLPNKGDSLLTQFLNWLLTIGRLLIILTHTTALSIFIYRFTLDMKIVDLHDEIKNESRIVGGFQNEETFRTLQQRLTLAKKYDAESDRTATIFKDIAEMGRGKITFKSVIVSLNSVKIVAQAPSTHSLSLFINALKNYPAVKSIAIDQVENKTSAALVTVGVTVHL